jgi:hypothetical protein
MRPALNFAAADYLNPRKIIVDKNVTQNGVTKREE